MTKEIDKDLLELAESLTSTHQQEMWENKELGNDEAHISIAELKVDAKDKIIPTSIRLPKELIKSLQKLAKEDGLTYQTYLKMILQRHVNNQKKVG